MIHLFRALDTPMALDVGSGAVHMLDELAYDALVYLQDHAGADDDAVMAALSDRYPESDVKEAMGELRELIAQGYLDTPDDYASVMPNDSGIVKSMCLHAAHDCNLRCQYCFADKGEYHMRKPHAALRRRRQKGAGLAGEQEREPALSGG